MGEVDPLTFDSLLVPGLYLVGGANDEAGICGGFNMQYAIGSGVLAGKRMSRMNETD